MSRVRKGRRGIRRESRIAAAAKGRNKRVPYRRVGLGSGTSKMKGGARRKMMAVQGVERKARRFDQTFEERLSARLSPTGRKIEVTYQRGYALCQADRHC